MSRSEAWSHFGRWVSFQVVLATCTIACGNETSKDIEALKELEARVQETCHSVMDAVVSVNGASGVIITEDGVVLTQYHVTHRRPGERYESTFQPGHEVTIVFADGRASTAKILGADQGHDISLVQLTEKGPFPFVPLHRKHGVKLGDWVIKLGHPSGYHAGRRPVARLGTVVSELETDRLSIFNSDCALNGGDSGGPYFDLNGNLVGMIEGGSRPSGLSTPPTTEVRTKTLWAVTTTERIEKLMPSLLEGKITPGFERQWPEMYQGARVSASEHWTQGQQNLAKWQDITSSLRQSIVTIYDGNYQIALGTVAAPKGIVVTKASILPEHFSCVLVDGTKASAKLLGMDAAFDIAVLQLGTTPKPVRWRKHEPLSVGALLAAPGQADSPLAVGIVSVTRRQQQGPFPNEVVYTPRQPASPPGLAGFPVEGHGLVVVSVDGVAEDAGFLPGDELVTLASSVIKHEADLASAVRTFHVGDTIQATVIREGKMVSLDVKLDNRSATKPIKRRSKFPEVFEHDAPVMANELGGPIVNLNAEVCGVSIGHVSGYGCAAIPSDVIQKIVSEHAPKPSPKKRDDE